MKDKRKFMNPYLAGFLLGLTLLAAFYLTGRGLGASGAVKTAVVTTVNAVSPEHAQENYYYKNYLDEHDKSPLKAWLLFLIGGVIVGAIVSGATANRLEIKLERGPKIKSGTRIIFALIGGAMFGFGAQLGRGCTSGAALSGMAVLSTAGFITMLAIFGTGYVVAYFFRKLWI